MEVTSYSRFMSDKIDGLPGFPDREGLRDGGGDRSASLGRAANLVGIFAGGETMPSTFPDKPGSESLSFVGDPSDPDVDIGPWGIYRENCVMRKSRRSSPSPEVTLVDLVCNKSQEQPYCDPQSFPMSAISATVLQRVWKYLLLPQSDGRTELDRGAVGAK